MLRWLLVEFSCRFSLTRAVLASLFLGAILGLNVRTIGPLAVPSGIPFKCHGWPLPYSVAKDDDAPPEPWGSVDGRFRRIIADAERRTTWLLHRKAVESYRFPFTHQAYRLLDLEILGAEDTEGTLGKQGYLVYFAIFNGLFVLTVLTLILFLQIPRRKVAAKVE